MWREISASVFGGWRLFLKDEQGFGYFNVSIDGFWRSFLVIIPALALSLLTISPRLEDHEALWIEGVAMVGSYLIYPLIMIVIARRANLTNRYAGYVIAINWTSLIVAAVYALVGVALFAVPLGDDAPAINALVVLIVVVALFAYQLYIAWFIAMEALGIPSMFAGALVMISLGLHYALIYMATALLSSGTV